MSAVAADRRTLGAATCAARHRALRDARPRRPGHHRRSPCSRAIFWAFPLYWAARHVASSPTTRSVQAGFSFWPEHFTLDAYIHVAAADEDRRSGTSTRWSPRWRSPSLVVIMAAGAGYAISQLKFPGRRLLWWMILASFMVPVPALIVNHFILISQLHLINTCAGIILPQLIAPVTVIVYKQFFDSVPKEFREAAMIDGANEFQLLFRLFLPMNWGITTALAHHHLHRRLEPCSSGRSSPYTEDKMMTSPSASPRCTTPSASPMRATSPAPSSPACRSRSST